MNSKVRKVILIEIIICALILIGILGSYAYFISIPVGKNQSIFVETGNMALSFEDGNTSFQGSLRFGESAVKSFTIENTGSLDASAKLNWANLINTYMNGSLTFTLSYSETKNGDYTEIISNANVPQSTNSTTTLLVNYLKIPSGVKYYYELKITLNYLESTDQTSDLSAIFSTHFSLEEADKVYLINFNANGGVTPLESKLVKLDSNYGELPIPVYKGYTFLGWFTELESGEKITEESVLKTIGNKTLYAHWEEKITILSTVLISQANDKAVSTYASGNKGEMFVFSHPATDQTSVLTDYRYIGSAPNNYINFNNETWRIIGVFTVENENRENELRIKIVRDKYISNIAWNTTILNEWPGSSLELLLNGDFYNRKGAYSTTGLNEIAKSQIAPTKFYLGASTNTKDLVASAYYSFERGSKVWAGSRSLNVIRNVGLMYPSDYVYTYANGVNSSCFNNAYTCSNANSSWLFNSTHEWTISPGSSYNHAINITNAGIVTHTTGNSNGVSGTTRSARPVVYLRANVEITEGTGTSTDPYQIVVPTD